MSVEATLWGDQFAPVTSSIGFLRAPLDVVEAGLVAWRQQIHDAADSEPLQGGLYDNVERLEPLTGRVRPRELLVATANPEWTATFDCGVQGADPVSTVGYLARTLKVQGVAVCSIPDVREGSDNVERFGARQLEIFAPIQTHFLNYVRTLSVTRDGARWRFDSTGTVQDFEDVEAYNRRKVADRFTTQMLVDYSAALGLHPFDEEFYPGPSFLVRNSAVPPHGAQVLSIREAQQRAGIAPSQ